MSGTCCIFLHIVYPVLPVSLDCPFLIAPLVFSNVYFIYHRSSAQQKLISKNMKGVFPPPPPNAYWTKTTYN